MPAFRNRYSHHRDSPSVYPYPDRYKGSVRARDQPAPAVHARPGSYHPTDAKSARSTGYYGVTQPFERPGAGHASHTAYDYSIWKGNGTTYDDMPCHIDHWHQRGLSDLSHRSAQPSHTGRSTNFHEGFGKGVVRDPQSQAQAGQEGGQEDRPSKLRTGQASSSAQAQRQGARPGGGRCPTPTGSNRTRSGPLQTQVRPATQGPPAETYGGFNARLFSTQYAPPDPAPVADMEHVRLPFAGLSMKRLLTRPVSKYSTPSTQQHNHSQSQHNSVPYSGSDPNPDPLPYVDAHSQANWRSFDGRLHNQSVQSSSHGRSTPDYRTGQLAYPETRNHPVRKSDNGHVPYVASQGRSYQNNYNGQLNRAISPIRGPQSLPYLQHHRNDAQGHRYFHNSPYTQSTAPIQELNRNIQAWSQPWVLGREQHESNMNAKHGVAQKNSGGNRQQPLINMIDEPVPTHEYMKSCSVQPNQTLEPLSLLVVLDLNGTLLVRNGGSGFQLRPRVKEFLHYLFENHFVMIWSSARAVNVKRITEKLLEPHQLQKVVGVWARENLRLTPAQFGQRVQVYKHLSWIWQSRQIQSKNLPTEVWSQNNTILIDDSIEKAKSEPYNLVQIEEFTGQPEQLATDVLGQVVQYLERLKYQANVSSYIKNMSQFMYFEWATPFDWSDIERSMAG